MGTLVALVNLRRLLAMFLTVAVLTAPALGRGDALAAVPHHDMQMMQKAGCHSPTSQERQKRHHGGDMSCCTAMSLGITPLAAGPSDEPLDQIAPAPIAVAALHTPFLGELATPPPRSA